MKVMQRRRGRIITFSLRSASETGLDGRTTTGAAGTGMEVSGILSYILSQSSSLPVYLAN